MIFEPQSFKRHVDVCTASLATEMSYFSNDEL